jgi:hypothetical protein
VGGGGGRAEADVEYGDGHEGCAVQAVAEQEVHEGERCRWGQQVEQAQEGEGVEDAEEVRLLDLYDDSDGDETGNRRR